MFAVEYEFVRNCFVNWRIVKYYSCVAYTYFLFLHQGRPTQISYLFFKPSPPPHPLPSHTSHMQFCSGISQLIIIYLFPQPPPLPHTHHTHPLTHSNSLNDISQLLISYLFLNPSSHTHPHTHSFVMVYRKSNITGPLPLSPSGKVLQDVLSTVPHVVIVGSKPSTTYVILKPPSPPSTLL